MRTHKGLFAGVASFLVVVILGSMLFTSFVPYTTAHTKTEVVEEKITKTVPMQVDSKVVTYNPDGTIKSEEVTKKWISVTYEETKTKTVIVPHEHWYNSKVAVAVISAAGVIAAAVITANANGDDG